MRPVSYYTPWIIYSEHLEVTCFPRRNKSTWSHPFVSHSLRATGWRKAPISQPWWNPARELGLQHLWPEELHPRRSSTFCVRTHSSRGHGSAQCRGPPAGAPQWPAWPVPSSWWGWSKAFCDFSCFRNQCTAPSSYITVNKPHNANEWFPTGIFRPSTCDFDFLVFLIWVVYINLHLCKCNMNIKLVQLWIK